MRVCPVIVPRFPPVYSRQVVGGFFGMNLDSGLQEAPRVFNAVAITTSTGCLLAFGLFIYFLHAHKLLYY